MVSPAIEPAQHYASLENLRLDRLSSSDVPDEMDVSRCAAFSAFRHGARSRQKDRNGNPVGLSAVSG